MSEFSCVPFSLVKALQGSNHFSRSSAESLTSFVQYCQTVWFDQGEVVLEEGQQNEWIYLILEGRAQVYSNGEPILLLDQPCELIGEMSVIANDVTAAQVVALTKLKTLRFSEKQIRTEGDGGLIQVLDRAFLSILTGKLRRTTTKAEQYEGTKKALTKSEVQRIHVQQDLATQEEILSSVLSSINEGVVVIFREERTIHSNAGYLKMMGQSSVSDDLYQWPAALGLYQSDQKTLMSAKDLPMVKALSGVMVENQEIFVKNEKIPEGKWLLATSRPLRPSDPAKPSVGAVVVLHDYTTRKLEEEALLEAKNLAEQESKAKASFLSMITHEMGTPLNAVIGMTDILLASGLPHGAVDSLQTIKGSSESLLTVIRNLLEYQQAEDDNAALNLEPVDIGLLLAELSKAGVLMAKEQGLELVTEFKEAFGWFSLDRKRLSLMLINLLHNAIKFTPAGKVSLGAELSDGELRLWVKDTGIGISPEDQANLFQPFAQAESGLSRKYPGLGIGLILVRKVARLMGGDVQIDSELGKGTTADLRIQAPPMAPPQSLRREGPLPEKEAFALAYPYKILVAEDNKANASLIKKVLGRLGYESTWAMDGKLAWEAAVAGDFDLILMDIQMPEMDGLEATERIIADMKDKAPLIVALTANSEDGVRQRCTALGMSGYLTKPLRVPQLTEVLASLHPCPENSV